MQSIRDNPETLNTTNSNNTENNKRRSCSYLLSGQLYLLAIMTMHHLQGVCSVLSFHLLTFYMHCTCTSFNIAEQLGETKQQLTRNNLRFKISCYPEIHEAIVFGLIYTYKQLK